MRVNRAAHAGGRWIAETGAGSGAAVECGDRPAQAGARAAEGELRQGRQDARASRGTSSIRSSRGLVIQA